MPLYLVGGVTLRKSRALAFVMVLLVSLLVVACGQTSAPPAVAPAQTGAAQAPPAAAKSELRIGALVPASGPNAEWGKKNTIALKMLEEKVNKAGGVDGHPVKILIYDTAQKNDQAANLVRKLAQDDKALAIAGPLFSGECEVAFPVANQQKIVVMSQASSKPGVSKANRPWAFRNTMTEDKLAAKTVPAFVKAFNVKKVGIIYDAKDATSTTLGKDVLPAAFRAAKVEIANEKDPISFQSADTDLSAQVTKLKALGVDGLILGADYGPASNVLREMTRQGVKIPVVGGTPLLSTAILQAHGDIPVVAPATYYPDLASAKPFTAEFLGKAGEIAAENRNPNHYETNIYDTVMIYLEAFKKTGATGAEKDLEADRTKIRDYVATLKDYPGVAGAVSMDPDGDAIKATYVIQATGNKWVEVK